MRMADDRTRWWGAVALAALSGAMIRFAVASIVVTDERLGLDATWYLLQADNISSGRGFSDPASVFDGRIEPTAAFGPGYPTVVAAWQAVVGDGLLAVRLLGVVIGAATIAVTAWLACRLAGPGVGLAAAWLSALHPSMWAADAAPMAEGLAALLVMATTLALVESGHRRRGWSLLAAGCLGGAAVLTRPDSVVVVALVTACIVLWPLRDRWRRAVGAVALVGVAAAVVVVPWVARNQSRLGVTTLTTASTATAFAGANCDLTYGGPMTGGWAFACIREELRGELGEVGWTTTITADARSYAADRPVRLVAIVVPARIARVWQWWHPGQLADLAEPETRSRALSLWTWPVVLGFQVAVLIGARRAWRAGARPLVAIVVSAALSVTVIAAIAHGNPRFRAPIEPLLALGAAAAFARPLSSPQMANPGVGAGDRCAPPPG
jgi:4-amino-4-deoxy-L-arabinose transferase-like glycosyltransferase